MFLPRAIGVTVGGVSPWLPGVLLGGSAFVAGGVNAIAGGGTLLTYPALLAAGVSPIHANATSTLSLVQGQLSSVWGFRKKLRGQGRLAWTLALPSLLGAAVGAWLLLVISEHSFRLVVPWLILGATLLFLASDRLRRFQGPEVPINGRRLIWLALVQLLVAIYGGFFGAAQSILMLATLGLAGLRDIDRMNALKNLAAAIINGVATALFIAGGLIVWRPALIMSIAAIAGGWAGAHLAQRIGQKNARRAVVLIGLGTAAATFWNAFHPG
jgi:uncharacterized membrane protein YfcA